MKCKILFLLMSLFLLVPCINADETYYDYEIIELESLPEATEETVNKLFKVDNKYYLGEKLNSDYTPIPLGEDLKGVTIYIDIKSITYEFIDNLYLSGIIRDNFNLVSFNKNFTDKYGYVHLYFYKNNFGNLSVNHYSLYPPQFNANTTNPTIGFLENGDIYQSHDSFVSNLSFSITEWLVPEISQYFSLTPFEVIYQFKEIPESLVVKPEPKEVDFYLFYSFEDIQRFKALSNFNLADFTDFEKVTTVLIINILFLGFLGFCCYILLKFVYKGISMLFR